MFVVGFLVFLLLAGIAGAAIVVRDLVLDRPVAVPVRSELIPDDLPREVRRRR